MCDMKREQKLLGGKQGFHPGDLSEVGGVEDRDPCAGALDQLVFLEGPKGATDGLGDSRDAGCHFLNGVIASINDLGAMVAYFEEQFGRPRHHRSKGQILAAIDEHSRSTRQYSQHPQSDIRVREAPDQIFEGLMTDVPCEAVLRSDCGVWVETTVDRCHLIKHDHRFDDGDDLDLPGPTELTEVYFPPEKHEHTCAGFQLLKDDRSLPETSQLTCGDDYAQVSFRKVLEMPDTAQHRG